MPVEIKSSAAPPLGPYDNHVAQLMGYCLLVEDGLQRNVPEGILRYRDGEVRIPSTPEKQQWVPGNSQVRAGPAVTGDFGSDRLMASERISQTPWHRSGS